MPHHNFEQEVIELKKCDIWHFLQKVEKSLSYYFEATYPNTDYRQFRKNALKIINSEEITDHSISQCWDKEPRKSRLLPSKHKNDFFYAFAYVSRTRQELERNSETAAWSVLMQAIYFIGLLEGYSELKTEIEKDTEAKRKGGNTTSTAYDPIRTEAARLLEEEAPEEGWTSHDNAADAIYLKLEAFIATLDIKIPTTDTYELVKRWLSDKDGAIRKIYDANRKKGAQK